MRVRTVFVVLVTLATVAVAGAGCGSSASPGPRRAARDAALILDFTPNAIHTGIYAAIARGFDAAAGVRLHVIVPSASTDAIKLLQSGRADFAILDVHDLAIARARGQDIVGIMAIVQRPLAAVIAQPRVRSPRQLDGQTVGITGVPSDTAVLRSIVAGAGGAPQRVQTVTIGFNAVPALLSGRVAGATAFWNDEGVTLQRRRPGFHVFRVDAFGAPPYPELVLCATGTALRRNPGLARDVVKALVRGYAFTLARPAAAAAALEAAVPGLDPGLVAAELAVERPAFRGADGRVGTLDRGVLEAWAAWEARFGIVPRPPDVAATFNPSFLAGA